MEKKFEDLFRTLKAQEAVSLAKANDIINSVKSSDIVNAVAGDLLKKENEEIEERKKTNVLLIIISVILGLVAIAAIAYGLYCYFTPDYLEDFEDDLLVVLGGQEDDGEPGRVGIAFHQADEVQSRQEGHLVVEEHEVKGNHLEDGDGARDGGCRVHVVVVGKPAFYVPQVDVVVINDEDGLFSIVPGLVLQSARAAVV